ncbi:MAG: lysophospholipid acyltransferase family protein [bacterium]|nr:lysophospholipid acyltransferase family protein [bacterium]
MINFLSKLVFVLVIVITRTLRLKIIGKASKNRAIYTFWHNSFFPLIYPFRQENIALLVSAHKDGEYLSRVATSLGYKVIRGSSRGAHAISGTLELLKLSTSSIAFATDGPRGPRHIVKIGIIKISELSGLPIIPAGIGISKYMEFNSWDKFQLPLPFARCVVNIGNPFFVKKCDEETRKQLEDELVKLNKDAEYAIKRKPISSNA